MSVGVGDIVRMKSRSSNLSHLTGLVLDTRENKRVRERKMTTVEELLVLWDSDDFVGPSGYFLSDLFEVVEA
jgi:hypothetical protein